GVDAPINPMLHTGRMLINLKPRRTGTQPQTMDRLKQRVSDIAGVALYLQPTQDLTIDAESGPTQYRVSLEAADNATVSEWANKLTQRLQSTPQVRNVVSDADATGIAAFVNIDRDTASRLSISAASIDDALYSALGKAVDAIRTAARDLKMPGTVTLTFLGAAGAYQASLTNQLWLILAAVVCVYIVLGVLYESYIHPLTILSTLPSAGVGALLALLLTGHELGVIAIIGLILLIGIVKKNAIMMIDFAIDAEREEGKSPREAIHQAALLRFRPILMTTMAALFAAIP